MLRSSVLPAVALLFGCMISNDASANFRLLNHSNETIRAQVLRAEVFGNGHVDQLSEVTLRPGERHDFITNDVVPGRVLYLFLYSETSGRAYFETYPQTTFSSARHHGHVVNAPHWQQPFNKGGNKFVAQATADGNFSPLVNWHSGARPARALRIVPKQGGHKAFQFRYRGMSGGFEASSW